jgi:hypothetical protein
MFCDDEFFQRGQARFRGFHQQQDFRAGFDFSLPPIVGFQFRNQVRAGNQPRAQGRPRQLPRDWQIRRRHEHQEEFCGGFHKARTEFRLNHIPADGEVNSQGDVKWIAREIGLQY